ncbi:C-C motif chemokine 3 [Oryzias melastigma]|uniref:C-C motif chemokine 3 n=1 Tax=Oryzias melastigma TaxID=30732 RepID=A0A834C4F7_ORYME|nr:C-C motif chemokine 3 [Oryzias melastigma]
MADTKMLFCFFAIIICCCSVAMAQIPVDCCLSVMNQTLDKKLVADYYPQAKGCTLDATILVTRKGRKLCAPHDELWVQDVKKHVDHLKKLCKKQGYKGRRCFGVKHQ